MRYRRYRCGARGYRGRSRRCAARPRHGVLHGEHGQHRQHALQPRHRRHRQGASRPRAGRSGRRDGARGGQGLHTVPYAQPRQGAGGALAARAGRPAAVSGSDEAHARIAGESPRQAGRGHRYRRRGRARPLRHDAHGCGIRLQGRRDRVGHISRRAHNSRRGSALIGAGRSRRGHPAGGAAEGAGA